MNTPNHTGNVCVPITIPATTATANTNPWFVTVPHNTQWITVPSDGYAFCGGNLSGNYDLAEAKKPNKDGCNCKKCKEFFPYAEANQEDGSLICYSCRMSW